MILQLFVNRPKNLAQKSVSKGLLQFFNKFNLQDAYFFYKSCPLLVSKFSVFFFDDPLNWDYFNAPAYLLFYCISFSSPLAKYQFFYKTQNFPNEELLHLPLNFNTKGLVYAENAASIRTANNSFTKIFSIGGQIISPVFDGVPPVPYTDARPAQVQDPRERPSVVTVYEKSNPNNTPYFIPNVDNTYVLVNTRNESIRIQSLIIYPIGFVETITVTIFKDLQDNDAFEQNSIRAYVLNNFKYFLLELPRIYELETNDRFFQIQIKPLTTAVDCIFFATKPIIGNEICLGQRFSKIASGFYVPRELSTGRIQFENLPYPKDVKPPISISNFNSNEVSVVIFSGDMLQIQGDPTQLQQPYTCQNVFSIDTVQANTAYTTLPPFTFQNYSFDSKFIIREPTALNPPSLQLTMARSFARTWDQHIINGNQYKLPPLFMINIGEVFAHSAPGVDANYWNNTLRDLLVRTLHTYTRMITLTLNKIPRLIFWLHDEYFTVSDRPAIYQTGRWSQSLQDLRTYIRKYCGATQSNFISRQFIRTLNTSAGYFNQLVESQNFVIQSDPSYSSLQTWLGYELYNPAVNGANVINYTTQFYLTPALNWFVTNKLFNRILTDKGDVLKVKDLLTNQITINPPASTFKQNEEIELLVFLGDFLWSGTQISDPSGYPVTINETENAVYSFRYDDPAVNEGIQDALIKLQNPVPFENIRNFHNLAGITNVNLNIRSVSPVSEAARRYALKYRQGLVKRRMIIMQCNSLEVAQAVPLLNYNGWRNPNDNNLDLYSKWFLIWQKFREWCETQKIQLYIRHVFWSDWYSWQIASKNVDINFLNQFKRTQTSLLTVSQIWDYMTNRMQITRMNMNVWMATNSAQIVDWPIDPNLTRITKEVRARTQIYRDAIFEFTNKLSYFDDFIFQSIKGPSANDTNFYNLYETRTGYIWRPDTCYIFGLDFLNFILTSVSAPPSIVNFNTITTNTIGPREANAPTTNYEIVPGVLGKFIQDANSKFYLGQVDYVNSRPVKVTNDVTFPTSNFIPGGQEVAIFISIIGTNFANRSNEVYATPQTFTKSFGVDAFKQWGDNDIIPDNINFIPFTNSFDAHNIGYGNVGGRLITCAQVEFSKQWENAARLNPSLPNLYHLQYFAKETATPYIDDGQEWFISDNLTYTGKQITKFINSLRAILKQFADNKNLIRIVGFYPQINTSRMVQQFLRQEGYNVWFTRIVRLLHQELKTTSIPIYFIDFLRAGPSYITTATVRQNFTNRMFVINTLHAGLTNLVFTFNPSSVSTYSFATPVTYGLFNDVQFCSWYLQNVFEEAAKYFFNLNQKSDRIEIGNVPENFSFIDNGARGVLASRKVIYSKYDMFNLNDGEFNIPDMLYTFDLFGNGVLYNRHELESSSFVLYDFFYLEWNSNSIDGTKRILVPVSTINVNLIATCLNRSRLRKSSITCEIEPEKNTNLKNWSPIWKSKNKLIASLLNYSSLEFPALSTQQPTLDINVFPSTRGAIVVDLLNDIQKTKLLTTNDKYENEYLCIDEPFKVVYKMFLPAFSYSLYYQLKHVNFIQIEIKFDITEQNRVTLNRNIFNVYVLNKVGKPSETKFGISATIFPEFAFATLYLFNSNNDDVQLTLYSSVVRQFRSTVLPLCIINEQGQVYCRYHQLTNLDEFEIYVQQNSFQNFTQLRNYLSNSRIFLFLTN